MEEQKFKVIIVEDVKLELKGTEEIFRHEIDVYKRQVYSLNKYLAKTLEVIESMIKEPLFPEKELHTILDTNIQQYLVNTSKVDFLSHRSLLKSLYGEQHPCGKIVVEEDYHAITPEVLREFYERYYHLSLIHIWLKIWDFIFLIQMRMSFLPGTCIRLHLYK